MIDNSQQALVVGAGGIGSWLAFFLHELQAYDQMQNIQFSFADDDEVDTKNLSYQNFEEEDLMQKKVDVLELEYGFIPLDQRITSLDELQEYDLVVSAVDNIQFRKMIFENIPNNSFYWIDLRSEGNNITYFTKGISRQKALDSIDENNTEDQSCQRDFEFKQGIIQNGNKIIASIGSQLILNWNRNQFNKKEFVQVF